MSAPARAPFYYEPLSNGEVSMPPEQAAGWLVDDLVSTARAFPDWLVDDLGFTIDLSVLEHEAGQRAVIFWRTAPVDGTITATVDPSFWVKIVGTVDGREAFTAYLDRPWEQYELWPPGAQPQADEEAPGQMGKKQVWVGLSTTVWPALAALSQEGGISFSIDEDRLRARMDRDWTGA